MVAIPADDEVELLDLGSGPGASLQTAWERLGMDPARALGVELDPELVEEARALGRPVIQGDVTRLDPARWPNVRVVMIDNVLEHLFSIDDVRRVLAFACEVAGEFVHVRHPSFEDVEYLRALGLKQYWTDWSDHPLPLSLAELLGVIFELRQYRVATAPVLACFDSGDVTVVPLDAPRDTRRPDAERITDTPEVEFDHPVYYAYDIVVGTGGVPTLDYPSDHTKAVTEPRVQLDAAAHLRRARARLDEVEPALEQGNWALRQLDRAKQQIQETHDEAAWLRRQLGQVRRQLDRTEQRRKDVETTLRTVRARPEVRVGNKLRTIARRVRR